MGGVPLNVGARRVRPNHFRSALILGCVFAFVVLVTSLGARPQNPNPPEIQGYEGAPPFQIRVERNLVVVRVVVRDPKGNTVGNLRKEDFRLFDEGKPQEITGFTVERTQPTTVTPAPTTGPGKAIEVKPPPAAAAQRFVALYFDDFHMEAEGIGRTRDAAWRYVTSSERPQDRVAILTATGKDQMDFTDDREKLHETLYHLAPRPHPPRGCPQIDDYEAYLADRRRDPEALGILHFEADLCTCGSTGSSGSPASSLQRTSGFGDPCPLEAERLADLEAADVWSRAEMESLNTLQGIELAVRHLAAMPGQRTLVLVSPGFLTLTQSDKIDVLINRALHEGVVISALDAAGLYARNPHGIIAQRPDLQAHKTMLFNMGTVASEDVMANLSAGTGGVFFHNSNDFDEGYRETAAVPEVYYVLSFSPQNIKVDGKFHSLKVTLKTHEPLSVQARRGYFATATELAEEAPSADELQKVIFSLDESHALPVEISTQVEKPGGPEPTLTVLIHVDLRSLEFHKEADRSVNTLIFDTALFDRDGKYVTGKESSLELHVKGQTLEKLSQSGIKAKTTFQMAPGAYRVREVVRDTVSKSMAALNCDVQVPGP